MHTTIIATYFDKDHRGPGSKHRFCNNILKRMGLSAMRVPPRSGMANIDKRVFRRQA